MMIYNGQTIDTLHLPVEPLDALLAWSPDGAWIAFASRVGDEYVQSDWWITRPNGSDVQRIYHLPPDYVVARDQAQNGRFTLTYAAPAARRSAAPTRDLVLISDWERRIFHLPFLRDERAAIFAWSPDGEFLAYARRGDLEARLCIRRVGEAAFCPYQGRHPIMAVAWQPDGG